MTTEQILREIKARIAPDRMDHKAALAFLDEIQDEIQKLDQETETSTAYDDHAAYQAENAARVALIKKFGNREAGRRIREIEAKQGTVLSATE